MSASLSQLVLEESTVGVICEKFGFQVKQAPGEEELLESVLYEVRMKYMAKINKIKLP